MNDFKTFKEFAIYESQIFDSIVKRKGKLLEYKYTEPLYVENGSVFVKDFTVYSFFANNEKVDTTNLNKLLNVEIDDDLLKIDPEDALKISKGMRTYLDKIGISKFPYNGYYELFKEAYDFFKHTVNKKYMNVFDSVYQFKTQNYNQIQAIKELSIYTNIQPLELAAIFDIKYMYIISLIARKVQQGKLEIKRY